jgi:hypothetical protein
MYKFLNIGYFIRIIIVSLNDMKVFLMILFIVEISFGEAFLRLSEASPIEGIFLDNFAMSFVYSFRLSIADTDTDHFGKVT